MKRRLTSLHWGTYEPIVADGRLIAMRGHAKDPQPSPIGNSLPGAIDGPSRIRRPAVRKGFLEQGPRSGVAGRGAEPFVEVEWDVALDLVARELRRVKDQHGNAAIFGGSCGWASAGRFHHAQSQIHRFLNLFGGYTSSVNGYSLSAAEVIVPRIVGDLVWVFREQNTWAEIADHTDLVVSFGGIPMKNTQVHAGGVSKHHVGQWLERCHSAGVEFVNISPLRDDMAAFLNAEWLAARPNTDTAIMLALAHTLVTEGLHDEAFLATHCVGFDTFRSYLLGLSDGQPKSPEWAEPIAQIDAAQIRTLARRMAAGRTVINASWSVQRADHGEQPYWMLVALAAILGQIGLPGGGFAMGYGAVTRLGTPGLLFPGPTFPQGDNPIKDFIPVSRICDMLLLPGATIDYDGQRLTFPDIRLIYWAGGNPFHHHQDLNRLLLAWRKPETIVVHEHYWNAFAKHADIVLPAATALERNDIGTAFFDNVVIPMHQAIAPVGESRTDFDIFSALAMRLGFGAVFSENRDEMQWLRHMYAISREKSMHAGVELPDFDEMWEQDMVELPIPNFRAAFMSDFRADPVAHPLQTPSGRIEIHSQTIASFGYQDCPGHPVWLEPCEWLGSPAARHYPLHLLSNQPRNKLHSQYDHGSNSIKDKIRGREPVWIHPVDAAARGIADGDVVRIFNDRGACLAGARVTEDIRPSVVQIATGAWYDPLEPGRIGSLDKHGNPNVLTRDKGTSRLAQGPSAFSVLVQIERYDGEPPPITAYDPPVLEHRRGEDRM